VDIESGVATVGIAAVWGVSTPSECADITHTRNHRASLALTLDKSGAGAWSMSELESAENDDERPDDPDGQAEWDYKNSEF